MWEQLALTYAEAKQLADAKAAANEAELMRQKRMECFLKQYPTATPEDYEMAESFGF
jgi:hypothetical protein